MYKFSPQFLAFCQSYKYIHVTFLFFRINTIFSFYIISFISTSFHSCFPTHFLNLMSHILSKCQTTLTTVFDKPQSIIKSTPSFVLYQRISYSLSLVISLTTCKYFHLHCLLFTVFYTPNAHSHKIGLTAVLYTVIFILLLTSIFCIKILFKL